MTAYRTAYRISLIFPNYPPRHVVYASQTHDARVRGDHFLNGKPAEDKFTDEGKLYELFESEHDAWRRLVELRQAKLLATTEAATRAIDAISRDQASLNEAISHLI